MLIKRPDKGTFKREKRKVKKMVEKYNAGELTKKEMTTQFDSWCGNVQKRFGNTRSLVNVKNLYRSLLKEKKNGREN